MVAYYILGGPYAMQMEAHVRMDLFYAKQSPVRRAWWDGFTVFALLFYLGVMVWGAAESLGYSFGLRWVDGFTPCRPLLLILGARLGQPDRQCGPCTRHIGKYPSTIECGIHHAQGS